MEIATKKNKQKSQIFFKLLIQVKENIIFTGTFVMLFSIT